VRAAGGQHDGPFQRAGQPFPVLGDLVQRPSLHVVRTGDVRERRNDRVADDGDAVTCCLPSGLSPSVLEFHQVHRTP